MPSATDLAETCYFCVFQCADYESGLGNCKSPLFEIPNSK